MEVHNRYCCSSCSEDAAWTRGTILAEGQNLSRYLMEAPANIMTPSRFAEIAQDKLGKLSNVEVRVRLEKNMSSRTTKTFQVKMNV